MDLPLVVQRLSDGENLRRLRLEALADAPSAFLGRFDEESVRPREEWQQAVVREVWFVAWLGPVPVGLASVVLDPGTQSHYVESMWVRRANRGQGIVDALLTAIEEYVVGGGGSELRLWVLSGNDTATRAYRRYGFRPTGLKQPIPGRRGVFEEEFAIAIPSRPGDAVHSRGEHPGGRDRR